MENEAMKTTAFRTANRNLPTGPARIDAGSLGLLRKQGFGNDLEASRTRSLH